MKSNICKRRYQVMVCLSKTFFLSNFFLFAVFFWLCFRCLVVVITIFVLLQPYFSIETTEKPVTVTTTQQQQQTPMTKNRLFKAIGEDDLQTFTLCEKMLNDNPNKDFLQQFVENEYNSTKNNLLLDCCKYGSPKILSYILESIESRNSASLKKLLINTNYRHLNTLLIKCFNTPNNGKNKELCFDLLLTKMHDVLKPKEFAQILKQQNGEEMSTLSVLKKDSKSDKQLIKKVQQFILQSALNHQKFTGMFFYLSVFLVHFVGAFCFGYLRVNVFSLGPNTLLTLFSLHC